SSRCCKNRCGAATHIMICQLLVFSHHDQRGKLSFPTRRSSDLCQNGSASGPRHCRISPRPLSRPAVELPAHCCCAARRIQEALPDRKSTRLNSSHVNTSYAVFCLKKKNFL